MRAGTTSATIEPFAAGIAEGLRDFLIAYFDERKAYAVLQEAADATAASLADKADVPL